MERTIKGLISCVFWAGIAAALAIQIDGYFWWVGILVGAFLGYLFCEPKEFFCAVRRAWYETTGWRLGKGWWKVLALGVLAFITTDITVVLFFIPAHLWPSTKELGLAAIPVVVSGVIGCFSGFVVFFATLFCLVEFLKQDEYQFDYREDMEFVKGALIYLNPASVFFYLIPWGLFRLAKVIISEIPGAAIIFGRFAKRVYILIHSEFRSLCAVDIAFGGTVGYFAGSMITGMIVGGVFWLINYRIIAQKILRLNFNTQ